MLLNLLPAVAGHSQAWGTIARREDWKSAQSLATERFIERVLRSGPVSKATVDCTVVDFVQCGCLVDGQAIAFEVGGVGCEQAEGGEVDWDDLLGRWWAILGVVALPEYGVQRTPTQPPCVVVVEGSRVALKVAARLLSAGGMATRLTQPNTS